MIRQVSEGDWQVKCGKMQVRDHIRLIGKLERQIRDGEVNGFHLGRGILKVF